MRVQAWDAAAAVQGRKEAFFASALSPAEQRAERPAAEAHARLRGARAGRLAESLISPVAIVTGADQGIGRAIALSLARGGFDLGITWKANGPVRTQPADEARALGRVAEIRRLDLTEVPDAVDAIDELISALGGLDIFVNNAGIAHVTPFLELTWRWRRTLTVDLDGERSSVCSAPRARWSRRSGRANRRRHVGARACAAASVDGVRRREARARRSREAAGARARGARHHGRTALRLARSRPR